MKKVKNEYFQNFTLNKIKNAINNSIQISNISHPGLKGQFREYTLLNLFKDFMPIDFGLGKGSMQDCYGDQSPESDLIIWRKDLLPPILFSEVEGIFPIDSCYYFFEIKSTASSTNIKDAIEKADRLRKMEFLANYKGPIKGKPINVFFAYSSDSDSIDELKRFSKLEDDFKLNPRYQIICIVGKGYWVFNRVNYEDRIETNWMFFPADGNYYEVLGLLAGVINTLAGQYRPSFGYYILDGESSNKGTYVNHYKIYYNNDVKESSK